MFSVGQKLEVIDSSGWTPFSLGECVTAGAYDPNTQTIELEKYSGSWDVARFQPIAAQAQAGQQVRFTCTQL